MSGASLGWQVRPETKFEVHVASRGEAWCQLKRRTYNPRFSKPEGFEKYPLTLRMPRALAESAGLIGKGDGG